MNVSIIIVNYNGLQFTRQCLESLFQFHKSDSLEVIVVDNNSTDGSAIVLPRLFPSIKFLSLQENKGFGAANNAGAKIAKGKYLFFVNNDTIFIKEILSELTEQFLAYNTIGIVGPKLWNDDGTFQLSFGEFPSITNELKAKKISDDLILQAKEEPTSDQPIEKDWVTGAALMIKREIFESVQGFDKQFFMYFEDIDLCRTVKKSGYGCFYVPSVSLIHLGGQSYSEKDNKILFEYRRSQLRYYDKHNSLLQRVMVRLYILIKFFPKVLMKSERNFVLQTLKLIFHANNKNHP